MTKRKRTPYTAAEIERAQQLFAEAKGSSTLKPPRGIAVLALSTGYRRAVTASAVTYRDYLADARRALARDS